MSRPDLVVSALARGPASLAVLAVRVGLPMAKVRPAVNEAIRQGRVERVGETYRVMP